MSKKNRLVNPATITSICAWCGKRISKDSEIFSLGAKVKAGVNLTKQEGGVIHLPLTQPRRTVLAIVPTPDSSAKKEGNDLLFAICSQECGQALKQALQQQIEMIDSTRN